MNEKTARARKLGYIAAPFAVLALVASLTGCNSNTGGSPQNDTKAGAISSNLYERQITLTDGRTVTCVVYANMKQGGLSCDWNGAAE
jgi:hypothetical protein